MLSLTTDYFDDVGCPEPSLRRIAEAGFSHIHWCHQWNTDFLYAHPEIDQIEMWLRKFGLKLCDLHASSGVEKNWGSTLEYERLAGVDMIQNRIDMTSRLGGDVIIMHLGDEPKDEKEQEEFWTRMLKSLDCLEACARSWGVRIAIENGQFPAIRKVLDRYSPEYVGLCYDCGHGNLIPDGLDQLDALKDRLISVHLHDNNGIADQHKLLFSGTVDWPRLARIIARSAYTKCVSMESNMRGFGYKDEPAFLAEAFETGNRFQAMVDAERAANASN